MSSFRHLLRRFLHPRRSDAGQITYALPCPAIFSKFYNIDTKFKDVDWDDWRAIVDGFTKRFTDWYFVRMAGGDFSYLDFCSLCALIETFTHYTYEHFWHHPGNYKEFLRKLDPVFRTRLARPTVVSRFERGKWRYNTLKDYADVFYAGIRCSLHHHGDLASYTGMSGIGEIARQFPDAGRSACGRYSYSLVVFDPGKIKEALHSWLVRYSDDLKAHPRSDRADIFRQNFCVDFGITIAAGL